MDKRSESYRTCCTSVVWVGTSLAAELMGAKKLWNHDAFFDYTDRWMSKEDPAPNRGNAKRPRDEGKTQDPFVDAMWAAHRAAVPKQEGAAQNLKWVWTAGDKGEFVPNPKGSGN